MGPGLRRDDWIKKPRPAGMSGAGLLSLGRDCGAPERRSGVYSTT
ncbi:MAG: hypothetical protein QOF19_293 [Alphaproteobacteria bacterium]|nr:hypothetical protein [Alphaproteobacteria bacterium]